MRKWICLIIFFSQGLFAAEETSSNFKIDQSFKDANRINFGKLYEKSPKSRTAKSNEDGEVFQSAVEFGSGEKPAKIEIVFDSSGSMGQIIGKNTTRMYAAKKVVAKYILEQWKKRDMVALRTYGSRRRNDCKDTFLNIPFGGKNLQQIQDAISLMLPIGRTPLYRSLQLAREDLKSYDGPKAIVVFTDGKDTCGGDLCKFTKSLNGDKSVDIRLFSIGVGIDLKSKSIGGLKCLGDAGDSLSAASEDDLVKALGDVSEKINTDTNLRVVTPDANLQVDLYVIQNGETKLFKKFTAGWPQTVPPGTYEAVVLTKPAYKFPRFKILPGKKVTLKMAGSGTVNVHFVKDWMDVELLDSKGVVKYKFKSGHPQKVEMGTYKVKVHRIPFYEEFLEEITVVPDGKYKIQVPLARSYVFKHPTTQGFYIYDDDKKVFGNYLTNTPLVLDKEDYEFYLSEKCHIRKLNVGIATEIGWNSCPKKKRKIKKK